MNHLQKAFDHNSIKIGGVQLTTKRTIAVEIAVVLALFLVFGVLAGLGFAVACAAVDGISWLWRSSKEVNE